MSDEPSLPRLALESIPEPLPLRKRARLGSSSPPAFSSDPIFSSDDDPSADNYTSGRQKKRYRGPWFRQEPADDASTTATSQKGRRKLVRQLDSGVFMGSDGTDISESFESQDPPSPIKIPQNKPLLRSFLSETRPNPTREELAQQKIELCLETGEEIIDISARGLDHLSDATIRPLASFSKVVPIDAEGDLFHPFTPALKIFLSQNALRDLPGELFKLENLNVLSLRNNKLQELPPAINNLRELVEMNVAYNRLRFLPYELLDLFSDAGRLHHLTMHPNPFYEPEEPTSDANIPTAEQSISVGLGRKFKPHSVENSIRLKQKPWRPEWNLQYHYRSPVRYFGIDGRLLKGPEFPHEKPQGTNVSPSHSTKIPISSPDDIPIPPLGRGRHESRVPSLVESVLRECSRQSELPRMIKWCAEDYPEHLVSLLELADEVRGAGGRSCTVCKQQFVLPRTEWIEWWEIEKVPEKRGLGRAASPLRHIETRREALVPLMRRGCSWSCGPTKLSDEGTEEASQ